MLRSCTFFVPLCLCIVLGCGPKYTGPETQEVEGLITVDGKPAHGVTVRFVPKQAGVGEEAIGKTDEQGIYRLSSVQGLPGQGAVIGEYTVMAQWTERYELEKPFTNPNSGELVTHGFRQSLPKGYNDIKTTPLSATIQKGKNDIPFELRSKSKQ